MQNGYLNTVISQEVLLTDLLTLLTRKHDCVNNTYHLMSPSKFIGTKKRRILPCPRNMNDPNFPWLQKSIPCVVLSHVKELSREMSFLKRLDKVNELDVYVRTTLLNFFEQLCIDCNVKNFDDLY